MFDSGIAFICEGETEYVFYEALIDFYCGNSVSEYRIHYTELGEKYRTIKANGRHSIIMMYSVSTISQITNSYQWLKHECFDGYPDIDWVVFLCYDTDSYKEDITQFYEGDWENFRKEISDNHPKTIVIDLAAKAEVEDFLLLDPEGIAKYLNVSEIDIPSSGKGKGKIKNIFRSNSKTYHEGKRAEKFIRSLNLEVICNKSPVDFSQIRKAIWGKDEKLAETFSFTNGPKGYMI